MFQNVVVGNPIIDPEQLLAIDDEDWKDEQQKTLFTETRFLPAIMKEAGIVRSISEVRRNKPELVVTLDELDCINIRWGKRFLYIIVGN